MKKLTIKQVALAVAPLIIGLTSINANAMCMHDAYRTYYLGADCRYYYIDAAGNKVVDGRYDRDALRYSNMDLKQDCHGRWYREDGWGNKVYVSRRCSRM